MKKEHPFLEKKFKGDDDSGDLFCRMCSGTFSTSNGGQYDINRHLKSDMHKKAMIAKASTKPVTAFFSKNQPESQDLELAAREGLFAFHSVLHNHSFRSMDCTSKIIKEIYDTKFTCSRTKCEAIAVKILSPYILGKIRKELDNSKYVTVSIDCSNHGSTKLLPIQIQYFTKENGISTKILDLHSLTGETSDILVEKLNQTIEEFGLQSKVIGLGADNTNTNFGGIKRKGKNNLFGMGCSAHIVHNAMEAASNCLPIAVESMIVKIYNYFHIYTVPTEELKEFCSFVNVNYQSLLGSSKTRWLSLAPAIERVLDLFEGVKSYFLSQSKCPKQFYDFFNDPKNELYLSFLLHQAKMFNDTVKLLEKEHACASEIGTILKSIINNLELRRSEQFIGTNTSKLLHNLIEAGEIQENSFREYTDSFFETAIEYLNNWTADFEAVQFLDWIQLRKQVKWGDLEKVVTDGKSYGLHIDESALFNEYSCLKAYLTNEKLQELQTIPKIDERCQAILSHFETETIQTPESIVEFTLCLPGTNASVERSFSILNNIWSSEKSQLSLETLKGLMNLKINANCSCKEFYADLRKQPEILKKIHSSEKYM